MNPVCAHIIDDDEAIRDALQWLFKTRGVACRTWEGGEPFLEAWQPEWRGCIVLDIRMHGMSGLECFDNLLARGCELPVIFITGHGDVPMAVAALKKGAFHFIEKPFNDPGLVDLVEKAFALDAGRQRAAASRETIEARLFSEDEIPWDELAFRTVRETLLRFFADRKAGAFGLHCVDID